LKKQLKIPIIRCDISGATGALVNIIGGPSMTLEECKKIN
jgi:cell division GTPase FtsZ